MSIFPLEIFPEGSLAQSVITTVWIGVFFVAFFNLRFGWPFSGLVVPGYLVPILISRPTVGLVIIFEGLLTYVIVRKVSDACDEHDSWSNFFGRDRFFAIVLVSLLLRIVLDGWLFPLVGEWINQQYGWGIDYRNDLSSFGLIISALIANQFWKTGIVRGTVPFCAGLLGTYGVVRYVLMGLTNFSIGNIEYMYETISASLLASPKAYVILVTTALIASRMNLKYAWEFNGILIPGLLALEWYQPSKIVFSFLEAGVVLALSMLVLRTPWFRDRTIERARKLLLFFNVSFAYKMTLAYCMTPFTTTDVTSYFGLGYLLPTLIAVKMHDKNIPMRMFRGTLQVSLVGVAMASVLGFLLTFMSDFWPRGTLPVPEAAAAEAVVSDRTLSRYLREEKVRLYRKRSRGVFLSPLAQEVDAFREAVASIKASIRHGDPARLTAARELLWTISYQLQVVEGRYVCLRDTLDERNWGVYVFDRSIRKGVVVEVPAPLKESSTLESGLVLFRALNASALAIAGNVDARRTGVLREPWRDPRALYHWFHREVARNNVLQVRGYKDSRIAWLRGRLKGEERVASGAPTSQLWVKRSHPKTLENFDFSTLLGSVEQVWNTTPFANVQREETRSGFAELILTRTDRKRLTARASVGDSVAEQRETQRLDGYVYNWLLGTKGEIAERGSNLYVPAKEEELLFFDAEVLKPLVELQHLLENEDEVTTEALAELNVIAEGATSVGYEVIIYVHSPTNQQYLILREIPVASRRHWGTYVFRVGPSSSYVIQVPRPIYEKNSFEYGALLFERLAGRALLVAGSHPRANSDGSADVVQMRNKVNLFNLVTQVMIRESPGRPLTFVQGRAFSLENSGDIPGEDILLAVSDGCSMRECLTDSMERLYATLTEDGFATRIVSGDAYTAGYEATSSLPALYARHFPDKEFCAIWMSPFMRKTYMQQTEKTLQSAQFQACNVSTRRDDVYRYLTTLPVLGVDRVPDVLVQEAKTYLRTADVIALRRLAGNEQTRGMERVIDDNTGLSFLFIEFEEGKYPLVVKLNGRAEGFSMKIPRSQFGRHVWDGFVNSVAALLAIGEDE